MPAPKFKPRKFSIEIDDPEEAQKFLEGLILAKQNNSSPYFPDLIEVVNSILQPYYDAVASAAQAGIGHDAKVTVE